MDKIKTFKVPIEISARHIHLSKGDFVKLFSKNSDLKKAFPLSQKEQFASNSYAKIFSKDKKTFLNLRILGPLRKDSQIELSLSDAYNLGYKIPLRISGNLKNTPKIKVQTNFGKALVPAIIPLRHLHLSLILAKKYGLKNNQEVSCRISGNRQVILNKIIIRTDKLSSPALHLDTDEGNACGIQKLGKGEILK
jgi:putative phosphotransacetylase